MRTRVGTILVIAAFIFITLETHYFGNNLAPMRKPEMACDVIASIVFTVGVLLLRNKRF
jgi:hypothetical protein